MLVRGKRKSKQENCISTTRPLLSWVGQRSVCHCYAVYLTHDMGDSKVKDEASPGSVTALVSSPGQSQFPVSGSFPEFPPWSSVSHTPADSGSFRSLLHTSSVNCTFSHSVPFSFLHLFSSSQFSHTCRLPVYSHVPEYAYND